MQSSSAQAIGIPSLDDHLCLGIYSASLAIQRTYKPMLDAMGITYPQYLVLHLLWTEDGQTVGHLARQLDLEPSTLTGQMTEKGRALQAEVGCMGAALIANSSMSLEELAELNRKVRQLRDNLNQHLEK